MKHLFLVFVVFCSCQTREVKFNAPVPGKSADTLITLLPEANEKVQTSETTNRAPVNAAITEPVESVKKQPITESVAQKNTAEPHHKKIIDTLSRNNPKGAATDGDGFIPFIKPF